MVANIWQLWEIPVHDTLDHVEAKVRSRVEWLLLRPIVPWQTVRVAPEWPTAPPREDGMFRVATVDVNDDYRESMVRASEQGRGRCEAAIRERLKHVLQPGLAAAAARCGVGQLAAKQRELHSCWIVDPGKRAVRRATAAVLWELPIAAVLRDVPEAQRAAVAAALAAAVPAETVGR